MTEQLSPAERDVIHGQVGKLFHSSPSFRQLKAHEQAAILQNTQDVVDVMVSNKLRETGARGLSAPDAPDHFGDPFAVPLAAPATPPNIIGLPGQVSGPTGRQSAAAPVRVGLPAESKTAS